MAKEPKKTSSSLDRKIAGKRRGRKKTIRFIVSMKDFDILDGVTISKQEIRDTKDMIEELRRRMLLFSQIESLEQRSQIWKALAAEFDELYITTSLLGEVNPTKAIQEILKKRKLFEKVRNTKGSNQ